MKACVNPKRVVAVVWLMAVFLSVAWGEPHSPKRVLLVFQDDGSAPAYFEFGQGVARALRGIYGKDLDFYREQLDLARFPGSKDQAVAYLRSRYSDRKIEVVIFVGNIPTIVLPGVPTIHVSNGPSDFMGDSGYRQSTVGLWVKLDVRKTIEAARRLQPRARKVLLISGSGMTDLVWFNQFRDQLKDLSSDLDIESVSNASVEELLSRLSSLPPDTIVLPISYTRDMAGHSYISRDVVERMVKASTAPVYAMSNTYVGTGVVGGFVVSWGKTGEIAAHAASQIIGGMAPADVSEPPDGTGVYLYDWRALKRWGFAERNLPKGSVVEYRVPTAWEQYRWRIVGIIALLLLQSVSIVALLINRNYRKKAEASLRDMTGRLLESQDDERRRIARDLHDGTGQHLSAMALTIGQVLADFPPGNDRLRKLLQDSHIASRQALEEVRTVSYVLHPPILDGLGLVPALQWYLDGLEKRTSLSIDFKASPELSHLSPEAERALFRIVQESITNVLRHSGGSAIRVELSNTSEGVLLEIEDNGKGMSAEQLSRVEGAATLGVGIAGMRERVRQLGGSFEIQSGSGGTRVRVTVVAEKETYAAHTAGR
jgi:signal transduction histidine kinase